jgi:hypothetical protein
MAPFEILEWNSSTLCLVGRTEWLCFLSVAE